MRSLDVGAWQFAKLPQIWLKKSFASVAPRIFSILARRRSSEYTRAPFMAASFTSRSKTRRRSRTGFDLPYTLLQIDQRNGALQTGNNVRKVTGLGRGEFATGASLQDRVDGDRHILRRLNARNEAGRRNTVDPNVARNACFRA